MCSCIVLMLLGHVKRLWPRHQPLLQHCGLSHLLRLLCADRSVRPGQRRHRRPDEAPGGEQQGSQSGGRERDGGRIGAPDGRGRHGAPEVAPAEPAGTGHGQVELWGFTLEVGRRRSQGTGKRRPHGLAHRLPNQRVSKHHSRPPIMPGPSTGGIQSFLCCLYVKCVFVT